MEAVNVVTVSGTPGSGKTTVAGVIAERLGLEFLSAGQLFREQAAKSSMSLAEFGKYCESHPDVDRALDAHQVEKLREGNVVLEGRLAGWMAHRNEIAATKVWLDADEQERVRRIIVRDVGVLPETLQGMRGREASERLRYLSHHGIDLTDLSIYDVIVDTTKTAAERLAVMIVDIIQRGNENPRR